MILFSLLWFRYFILHDIRNGKKLSQCEEGFAEPKLSLSRLVMFSISLSFLQILNVFKAQQNRAEETVKILLKIYSTISEFIFSVPS